MAGTPPIAFDLLWLLGCGVAYGIGVVAVAIAVEINDCPRKQRRNRF